MNIQQKSVIAVFLGAALSLNIPSQAQTTARSEAACRLSENGAILYEDDCSVREKNQDGQVSIVVKLDNGNSFRFVGPNRQNLRLDNGFGGFTNVLFEDKGARGVFT
jgi:DNA/RNA endonuclease YhcR with UshA esterase domain